MQKNSGERSPTYRKEITVTNLTSRTIHPKPGQTFQPFTVYKVTGNDGIIYQTGNREWYSKRQVGETIPVNYFVKTTVGSGNRIFSNYMLITPQSVNTNSNMVQGLTKIYARIEQSEKNILAKLDLIGSPKIESPKEVLPSVNLDGEESSEDEANGELNAIYEENLEEGEVENLGDEPALPF